VVSIFACAAVTEAGGDVSGEDFALPGGVLCCWRRYRSRVGGIGHGRSVTAGVDAVETGDLQIRSNLESALFSGQPRRCDERARDHAGYPCDGVGADAGPVAEDNLIGRNLGKGDTDKDLYAAPS
jgi:hypothetical protein